MFKKTLMAAALAAATGSAFAGDIVVSGVAYKVGNEYLNAYTGTALQGDLDTAGIGIAYKPGIALGINNTLKFEFSGGAISANTGLELYSIDTFATHADNATIQADIDTAVDDVIAAGTLGSNALDTAAVKAAAIAVINAAAAADGTVDGSAAIAAINAEADAALATIGATVKGLNTPILSNVVPAAVTTAADLVDFEADDNGDYVWALFKITVNDLTADDVLVFEDSDGNGTAEIVTNFTKATIGAGDLTVSMPEAKDDTGVELLAPRAGAQTLVTTANQFSVTANVVNDTIDVEQDRLFFVDTVASQATTGTFSFTVADDATIDLGIDAQTATVEFAINGNTAGVDSVDLIDLDSSGGGNVDSGAFDDDGMLAGTGIDSSTITVTVDGTTNLETRTVGLSVMVTPAEADTDDFYLLGGASMYSDAFTWGLNGSEITFPYAPIGYTHITTNFELANSGDQEGDILVTAIGRDGSSFSGTIAQAATAESLVKISQEDVYTALGLTEAASLSITFTTTAPEDDIKITGYSNLESGGRMALLSDAYETADCTATSVVNNDGTITETTDVTVTCD